MTPLCSVPWVTIARSVPGCRQPSWHRWHGLPTMGWLRRKTLQCCIGKYVLMVIIYYCGCINGYNIFLWMWMAFLKDHWLVPI